MYSFIFGFHRLTWCPKWTPASSSSFIVTVTNRSSYTVNWFMYSPARVPNCPAGTTNREGRQWYMVPSPKSKVQSPKSIDRAALTLDFGLWTLDSSFRELEALACALLSVLLALFGSRVAGDEASFL